MKAVSFFAVLVLTTLMFCASSSAQTTQWGGHLKVDSSLHFIPQEGSLREALGQEQSWGTASARINFSKKWDNWDIKSDYQIFVQQGEIDQNQLSTETFTSFQSGDQARGLNLTDQIEQGSRHQTVHRLDRLSIGYGGEHWTWRMGRQALSWGNGVFFHPMDIVNPFNPTTVDAEYKAGDDMLYAQYLYDSGNDIEIVQVLRQDPGSGEITSGEGSTAFKYHFFWGEQEVNLLLAEHYGDSVFGFGYSRSIEGALWRSDVLLTDTTSKKTWQVASNISYAWRWWQRNINGSLEYFYNGFGAPADCDLGCITMNTELLDRIERADIYTSGRQYLAFSANIELTPLLLVTPTLLTNLEDNSALAQVSFSYSWAQNLRLLAGVSQPIGPVGSEFGGLVSDTESSNLATGTKVFGQLAWYF